MPDFLIKSDSEPDLLAALQERFRPEGIEFEERTGDETRAMDPTVIAAVVSVAGEVLLEITKFLLERAKQRRKKGIALVNSETGERLQISANSTSKQVAETLEKATRLKVDTLFL